MGDISLWREHVFCWVVYRFADSDGNIIVSAMPMSCGWEALVDEEVLDEDCEIIAVVPAAPGIVRVWAEKEGEKSRDVGVEIPGADHPDWEEEYKAHLKRMASIKRKASNGSK